MRSLGVFTYILLSFCAVARGDGNFLQDCSEQLWSIDFSALREVQFPADESQDSVLRAFLNKEKKIDALIEKSKNDPGHLKREIQISIDKYISLETGPGYLPGQSLMRPSKNVDELVEDFKHVALKHADPINSELVNIIGNLKQSRDLGLFVLEMGKDYKIIYTYISPKILDLKLFEYLLQTLKEGRQI